MNIIDRPFEDMNVLDDDGNPRDDLKLTEEEKKLGFKMSMPFQLDDDGNQEFEDELHQKDWKNSDDTAMLLHDFANRRKPSKFQSEEAT